MEYLGGDIQAANMEEQGIFINICARLWDKNGYISSDIDILSQLLKVEKVVLISAIKTLEQLEVLKRNENSFFVSFILKELKEAKTTHKKRVYAGRKGGQTKALLHPAEHQAKPKQSCSNAKAMLKQSCSKQEEDREGDRERDKDIYKKPQLETKKRRVRVKENTPLMIRLNSWFSRRPGTLWSIKEKETLDAIGEIPEEDLTALELFYSKYNKVEEGCERRKSDLVTLLNNWQSQIDRAIVWGKNQARKPDAWRSKGAKEIQP